MIGEAAGAVGAIIGGVFRLAPEVIKLLHARADREHELAMMDKQAAIDDGRAQRNLDAAHVANQGALDQVELAAILESFKQPPTGIRWVDGMSATVRPVLTYWHCLGLYTVAKALVFYAAVMASMKPAELAAVAVTPFDMELIAGMFAYWFLDRTLKQR